MTPENLISHFFKARILLIVLYENVTVTNKQKKVREKNRLQDMTSH